MLEYSTFLYPSFYSTNVLTCIKDTGLQKGMSYNPRLRLWGLHVEPISQASANQRAGRAGRTGPGTCWRLYSKWAYDNLLIKDPLPGLLRGDMAGPILDILAIGRNPRADSIWRFDFIDPPSPEVIMRTYCDLFRLGCISPTGQLTPEGNNAWRLPLEPCHAMAIVRARKSSPDPVYEVAAIVTLLETENVFARFTQFSEHADIMRDTLTSVHGKRSIIIDLNELICIQSLMIILSIGDHFTLLNIWLTFDRLRNVTFKDLNAAEREARLERWCQDNYLNFSSLQTAARTFDGIVKFFKTRLQYNAKPAPANFLWGEKWVHTIKKVLLSASFPQIAVKDPSDEDTYRTLEENQPTLVHPASIIARGRKYDFIIYDKFVEQGKPYLTNAMGIDSQWLFEPGTVVSEFTNQLLNRPPPRSENWMSLARLRLARQRYDQLAAMAGNNAAGAS